METASNSSQPLLPASRATRQSCSRKGWIAVVTAFLLVVLVASIVLATSMARQANMSSSASGPNMPTLLINEMMAASSTGQCWIELVNVATKDVPLSSVLVQMNEVIATLDTNASAIVKAGDFVVFSFASCPQPSTGIVAEVKLMDIVQDHVEFVDLELIAEDQSFFRDPNAGPWSSNQTPRPTKGKSNAASHHGGFTSSSSVSASAWQPGTFEIHIFNVGQGDSQLIIFPSGYTIFIDLSESNWNTVKNTNEVVKKLDAILGKRKLNVGIISHLHLDHLGYFGYGGFYGLLEKNGYSFDKIIDRDAGAWVDHNKDNVCDPDTEIEWKYAGTFSGTATKWLCYATDKRNAKIYKVRQAAKLCSTTQINPPDANAQVQIVSADALGAKTKAGQIISSDRTKDSKPPSENDYSIGINVRFGDIEYATLGDLDGDYASSSNGYVYNDVEAVVAPRIGEVDIYRANHHGSGHSSSANFINTLKPTLSLISCGADNSYGHPEQVVLDRLLAKGDVWLTNRGVARNYGASKFANSDIVIRSTDGKKFTVEGGNNPKTTYTAKSKANKKVTCNAL